MNSNFDACNRKQTLFSTNSYFQINLMKIKLANLGKINLSMFYLSRDIG